MATTTKTSYGDELIDKGLDILTSAHEVALSAIRTGIDTLREYAPEAHDLVTKVDAGDARRYVDGAFETAQRVFAANRSFVDDILGSVLRTGKPGATAA